LQSARTSRACAEDGYAASHPAFHELKADSSLPNDTKWRSSKYWNNLIEQDHRGVNRRSGAMLGFKRPRNAAVTIRSVDVLRRIRKGEVNLRALGRKQRSTPVIWKMVLAA
jgi:putative transposase